MLCSVEVFENTNSTSLDISPCFVFVLGLNSTFGCAARVEMGLLHVVSCKQWCFQGDCIVFPQQSSTKSTSALLVPRQTHGNAVLHTNKAKNLSLLQIIQPEGKNTF